MTRYALEWDRKMKLFPENSHYHVYYSPLGGSFQLFHCQQEGESMEEKYVCPGSHVAIKSAFLIFGMMSYNCDKFVEHVKDNPVQLLVAPLSPEGSEVSYFSA